MAVISHVTTNNNCFEYLFKHDSVASSGIDLTMRVYKYDGLTWELIYTSALIDYLGEVPYTFKTDGLYKITYTLLAGLQEYFLPLSCTILACLKTLAKKIICQTATECEIANFNSIILSTQVYYGYLSNELKEQYILNFDATVSIPSLQQLYVIQERLLNYCNTDSTNSDCGCS